MLQNKLVIRSVNLKNKNFIDKYGRINEEKLFYYILSQLEKNDMLNILNNIYDLHQNFIQTSNVLKNDILYKKLLSTSEELIKTLDKIYPQIKESVNLNICHDLFSKILKYVDKDYIISNFKNKIYDEKVSFEMNQFDLKRLLVVHTDILDKDQTNNLKNRCQNILSDKKHQGDVILLDDTQYIYTVDIKNILSTINSLEENDVIIFSNKNI